jgi:hypothetical protein
MNPVVAKRVKQMVGNPPLSGESSSAKSLDPSVAITQTLKIREYEARRVSLRLQRVLITENRLPSEGS